MSEAGRSDESVADLHPTAITRPDDSLLTYYLLIAALSLVAFPFVFIPLWIKYHTLRYHIDDEGVSMSWGFLFRREILLTYRRIQDIHVRRNLFHRWLGLAEVALQTASGTAGAEMTIEGILQPERLRDYLYSKMRGVGDGEEGAVEGTDDRDGLPARVDAERTGDDEALILLREIRDALRMGRDQEGG